MLLDEFNSGGGGLNPFFRVMEIFVAEQRIKAVAVYADIVITHIAEKAVCCISFKVLADSLFFFKRTPLVGIMAGRTGDVAHMDLLPCLLVKDR